MTFKEFAGLLYEAIQRRGQELPLLVDKAGFHADDLPDFYEITVQFPPYPKTMSVMTALRVALSQSPVEATYLIRQGRIDIVPASRATLPHLLKQRITADFSRMPFTEVVHALAEMTGVSIQLDGRLSVKELPAVTARFRNDMALRDVLRVIADLAGAQVTELETGVVISAVGAGQQPGKSPPQTKTALECGGSTRLWMKRATQPEDAPTNPKLRRAAALQGHDLGVDFISSDGQADAAAVPEKRPVADKGGAGELLRRLREPIDMKPLQQEMTLKEALGIFYQQFQDKGAELPILIDQQAFKVANPEAPDVYETAVRFPPFPKRFTLAQALRLALTQVPTANATFWVRDDFIEITTHEALSFDRLKAQLVHGQFTRQPAHSVITELSDQSGVTVVLDGRAEEKLNFPVTLTLRNNVSVHDALRTVADMCGLRLVELPTSFYVTGLSSPLGEEARKSAK
jgi:hypothetical protein